MFQIHFLADFPPPKRRLPERFGDRVKFPSRPVHPHHGQATAIDRNRIARAGKKFPTLRINFNAQARRLGEKP